MLNATLLMTLGALFLAGLVADQTSRWLKLPRVTLLLLIGVLAGESGLRLLPDHADLWFELVSIIALTMVAFLLGGELSQRNLADHGRAILLISLTTVAATLVIVAGGLSLLGVPPGLALILGAVATATAPAAIADVIRQSGVKNGFTETLAGVVAIDDLWGLMAFSVALALAGQADHGSIMLAGAAREIGGAIAVGAVIGLPAALITGRLKPGEPLQAEAMGVVFLTAGTALWFEVSFLIAGITAGAVIVNVARHHDYAFHEIEHIEWPFLLLFFLLAGAQLEVDALQTIGKIGVLYAVLRIVARLIGAWAGAVLGKAPRSEARWYGPAMLPQAGVAIGMALVAGEAVPQWSSQIVALTISSTVLFELLGPAFTMAAIRRTSKD